MNIDWSEAPDDFPLWLEGLGEHAKHSGWYRRAGDVFEHETHGQFRAFREGQFFTVHHKPEQPAWTGEGLPPVGTLCEMQIGATGDWYKCTPKYYLEVPFDHSDQVVVDVPNLGGEVCYVMDVCVGCVRFRPIRTPEQIAEEARIAELNLMIAAIKDHPGGRHGVDHRTQLRIHEEVCIDLYDAGWRKQVAP